MDAGDKATQEQLTRAAKDKRERERVYEISGLAKGNKPPDQQRIKELEAENLQLKMEQEILKNSQRHPSFPVK